MCRRSFPPQRARGTRVPTASRTSSTRSTTAGPRSRSTARRLNAFRRQTIPRAGRGLRGGRRRRGGRGDRLHRRWRAGLLRGRRRARSHPHRRREAQPAPPARPPGLAIRNNGKPIIVKVRGYCIGGGNELNVLCDLTISGDSGKFGQAGPKIGSAPLWWGCQLLPQVVGEKKAREILYLTRQYSAEEALAMGLVNAVVPDDELDAEVDRWCDPDPAPLPPGPAPGQDRMNAADRPALLGRPARPRARRPQPRLRPRARRGDRLLPGEAPRRLAPVPRGSGPGARLMPTLAAPAPGPPRRGRGRPRGAAPDRRAGPRRSPTRAAPSTRPSGRRRPSCATAAARRSSPTRARSSSR